MKQIVLAVSQVAFLILVGLSVIVLYPFDAPPQVTSSTSATQIATQKEPTVIEAPARPAVRSLPATSNAQGAKFVTAKAKPAPAKPHEAAAKPVKEEPRFTVEMVKALRSEALVRRDAEREAALTKERSDHQWQVDWALRDDADAVFEDDHRAMASELRTDCRNDDADACAALGKLYAGGRGTDVDARLAKSLLFVACSAKSDAGCSTHSALENLQTREDISSHPHIAHFQTRCEEGLAEACLVLASEYRYGFGVLEQDEERGIALSAKACDLGSPTACKIIGNKDKALAMYQEACAADDATACSWAAGSLQKTDPAQHWALREKACTLSPIDYCGSFGERLAKYGTSDADQTRATQLMITGCEAGNQRWCLAASTRVEEGLGVPADAAAAETLLRKGCLDNPETPRSCEALMTTPFIDLDPTSAEVAVKIGQTADVAELSNACRSDDAVACRALSEAHGGLGTAQASFVAQQLIRRACALGDARACLRQLAYVNREDRLLHTTRLCAEGVSEACVIQIETDPALEGEVKYQQMTDLCEAENPQACSSVAEVFARNSRTIQADVQVDYRRAFELNKQACLDGAAWGCVNYGRAIAPDIDDDDYEFATRDETDALRMYEKSCALGLAYGCSMRAIGVERSGDMNTAVEYSRRYCAIDPRYCATLHRLLLLQERVGLNGEVGVLPAALSDRPHDFFPQMQAAGARARAACLADVSQACLEFGFLIYGNYSGGMNGTVAHDAADRTWARAAYARACELEDAVGCHILAYSFDGIGEESEPLIALKHHEHACEMGYGASCARAGSYHGSGRVIPEDVKSASDLYLKGCKAGDTYSCQQLSGMYDLEDQLQKAEYDMIACVNGDSLACEFISDDFERGRNGVEKSKEIAALLRQIGCEEDEDCRLN